MRPTTWGVSIFLVMLSLALVGCESLQRKFTRKPKHPTAPPSPIVKFLDYTRAMTPMDRYRKHYLMFNYWNSELITALQDRPMNSKRFKHASKESLAELQVLQGLVTDEAAARMVPIIEGRAKVHQRLQGGTVQTVHATMVTREVDAQTRQLHREFYWRRMEDQLKPDERFVPPDPVPAVSEEPVPAVPEEPVPAVPVSQAPAVPESGEADAGAD